MDQQSDLAYYKCFQTFNGLYLQQLQKKNASESETLRNNIKEGCVWISKHKRGNHVTLLRSFSEYDLLLVMFVFGIENDLKELIQHIYEIIICCEVTVWDKSVQNFKNFIMMNDEEQQFLVQQMSAHQHIFTSLPEAIIEYIKEICHSSDLLLKYSSEGNVSVVKFIIKLGVVVNATALHAATKNGHHTVVKVLLDNGAKYYWTNAEGYSALIIAAERGHTEVMKWLLQKAPNAAIKYEKGMNLLHIAANNGHINLVKFLLTKNFSVAAKTHKGETALHLSCKIKNEELTRILIENNGDVNALSTELKSPLRIAVENGQYSIVKMILGTKNLESMNGETPCHVAATNGHVDICELLYQFKANFEAVNMKGETPLHLAVLYGRTEVVEFLLSIMNDIDRQEMHGFTPLHLAARNGNDRILSLLLKRGANTEKMSKGGYRAVHIAEEKGHLRTKEILFLHGADVSPRLKSPNYIVNQSISATIKKSRNNSGNCK